MKTIKLKVSDKVYEELMGLLQQFDPKDLQIVEASSKTSVAEPEGTYGSTDIPIEEDEEFLKQKAYLQKTLDYMDSGKAKFYSIEELEEMLENTIRKYESKSS